MSSRFALSIARVAASAGFAEAATVRAVAAPSLTSSLLSGPVAEAVQPAAVPFARQVRPWLIMHRAAQQKDSVRPLMDVSLCTAYSFISRSSSDQDPTRTVCPSAELTVATHPCTTQFSTQVNRGFSASSVEPAQAE